MSHGHKIDSHLIRQCLMLVEYKFALVMVVVQPAQRKNLQNSLNSNLNWCLRLPMASQAQDMINNSPLAANIYA